MDEDFRHFQKIQLARDIETRREQMKLQIEQARKANAYAIQARKEEFSRSEREATEKHREETQYRTLEAERGIEAMRGSNAESLEMLRFNLGLQQRHLTDVFDELSHRRGIADTAHNALADGFKAVAAKLAEGAVQRRLNDQTHGQAMELERLRLENELLRGHQGHGQAVELERIRLENELLRGHQGHGQAIELERLRLENDLIRAQVAHEQMVGREEAQRQHETFLSVIQSRLRNNEVSHAEIVRLVVRMIEGASGRTGERDAKKWASDCFDEWEQERKGRI